MRKFAPAPSLPGQLAHGPRRRATRALAGLVAVAVLAVLGAMAASLARPPSSPAPAKPTVAGEAVLVAEPGSQVGSMGWASLAAYLPATNALRPLLDAAGPYVISPDGRQVVAVVEREAPDSPALALTAIATDSLEREWTIPLAAAPGASAPLTTDLGGIDLALTSSDIYVAAHPMGTATPVTIVRLERATGQERARWAIDTAGRRIEDLTLLAAQRGSQLVLVGFGQEGTTFLRVRTADGRVEPPDPAQPLVAPGDFWDARLSADGSTLYAVPGAASGHAQITLFDVASGRVQPPIDLPFDSGAVSDYLPLEQGLSPDGRRLYVLAPTIGQVAVVDLAGRRVERVVALDLSAGASRSSLLVRAVTALRGLAWADARAKMAVTGDLQLSPDGRWLYAVGVKGQSHDAVPDGVWAIDTTTWRVAHRWLAGVQVNQVALGGDGRLLYAQEGWGSEARVHVLDTATGLEIFATEGQRVEPLAALYLRTYGKSPSAAGTPLGQQPTDERPFAALAGSVSPKSVVQGDEVTVEARFTDPRSGKTVARGQRDVRFAPPERVTATLSRGGRDSVTVALRPVGYGVYRAKVTLPAPGKWSIELRGETPGSPSYRARLPGTVTVEQAFLGSDGRRYVLRVDSDPATPTVDAPLTVHATFLDPTRGTPLPVGVSLAGGLPDHMEASLLQAGSGITTARLAPTGYGRYAGATTSAPWAVGSWEVHVAFQEGGQAVEVEAGAIDVAAR